MSSPRSVDGRPRRGGRLAQPAFSVLLALVGLAAFTWPVVAVSGTGMGVIELFAAWAITVVVLALVARSLGRAGGDLE